MKKKLSRSQDCRYVTYVKKRIHEKNLNWVACFLGSPGKGKSYSGLRLCEDVDPTFDITRVTFSSKEFMRLINSGLPSGSAIMFEEAGVLMSSRNWQSTVNRLLNFVFQTMRSRNYFVCLTLPDFSMLDAQARKLIHSLLVCESVNRQRKICSVRPYMLQHNPVSGKTYQKFPKRLTPKGFAKTKRLLIGLPSPKLVEAYEVKKLEFTTRLYDDIVKGLEVDEIKKEKKQGALLTAVTEKQQRVLDLIREGKNVPQMMEIIGINQASVYSHIRRLTAKGYTFKPVRRGLAIDRYEIID